MPRTQLASRTLVMLVLAMSACVLSLSLAVGQDPPPPLRDPGLIKVDPAKGKYAGSASCAGCHTQRNDPYTDDYVRLNEYAIWSKQDKHSQAHKVLTEERSQQMAKLLGIPDASKANACLNCHAMNIPEAAQLEGRFDIKSGVSCDACHGPAEKWFLLHSAPAWRTKPMKEKEDLGFSDVRDPVKRARLCNSCHIGNEAEGRVVTHDMYAAGHPPLPGVELATFSDEMPRHWRYVHEKDEKVQKLLQEHAGVDPRELEKSKLAVVSAAVAFRDALELLAAEAARPDWPELAQFDCAACHHDLRNPSWRQARGYAGKPGRVPMREWPTELLKLAVCDKGPKAAELAKRLSTLRAGFDQQPFGDGKTIKVAAKEAADWASGLVKYLSAEKIYAPEALKLLHCLVKQANTGTPDYDSARQIAWAFRIIYREWADAAKPTNRAAVDSVLDELDRELRLKLPSGRGTQIIPELDAALKTAYAYDPEKFRQLMGKLGTLLRPPAGGAAP